MLTAQEYRESLRRYRPRVFVDGGAVESGADEPRLAPGINAGGGPYEFATRPHDAAGGAAEWVAGEPGLARDITAAGDTSDCAPRPEHAAVMTAKQATSGRTVNRLVHLNEHNQDLLQKLEAVRLVCRESGCAQRYLTH